MPSPSRPPLLLTPGPLTTSESVRSAMLRDWGSRDPEFIAMTKRILLRLAAITGGRDPVAVPLQGSGTFAVEAALQTFVGRREKVLVAVNGAYGRRMVRMCAVGGRDHAVVETREDEAITASAIDAALTSDPAVTHVAVVYCETTTGILNPLGEIAAVVARRGRRLLVDAMSAFGALPLDMAALGCDAVIASANKCLEGAPGVAFVIAERRALDGAAGNANTLSLDLHDQWRFLEETGQWRFTPPTHVLAALDRALEAFDAEGGVTGRGRRYRLNCQTLVDGLRHMGFETLLPDHLQAPIIVTVRTPADPRFHFETFYEALRGRGYIIYPGKLTVADSFRVGCIGHLEATDVQDALAAMGHVLKEMGVVDCRPPGDKEEERAADPHQSR